MGFSLYYGISPMPTSRRARNALFTLLPNTSKNVFELGSGWGNLIFPLAKRFPSAQIHAFEGSPLPWAFSVAMKKILCYRNLTIRRENFFKISLSDADLVVCYLYSGAMRRLKKKFQEELKQGTLIVTNTFAIPGWIPDRVLVMDDLWRSHIYLYKI
ncbi:MAG: class I SAM-dependent methyltransferase [Chlamydiales bacterium]|nr:class I SAM-dependent methyltransferase [Chlamydiales bacterium]